MGGNWGGLGVKKWYTEKQQSYLPAPKKNAKDKPQRFYFFGCDYNLAMACTKSINLLE